MDPGRSILQGTAFRTPSSLQTTQNDRAPASRPRPSYSPWTIPQPGASSTRQRRRASWRAARYSCHRPPVPAPGVRPTRVAATHCRARLLLSPGGRWRGHPYPASRSRRLGCRQCCCAAARDRGRRYMPLADESLSRCRRVGRARTAGGGECRRHLGGNPFSRPQGCRRSILPSCQGNHISYTLGCVGGRGCWMVIISLHFFPCSVDTL